MAIDEICIDGLLPPTFEHPGSHASLPRANDEAANAINRALRLIGDIHASRYIVWPARLDGELARPPMAHLIDRIVRTHVLGGASGPSAEAALRPEAFTIAATLELPTCSRCEARLARYDTQIVDGVSWSYLCPVCYPEHGLGRLGMGLGQYLVTWAEVDAVTRDALLSAKRHWSERGVDVPGHLPWE